MIYPINNDLCQSYVPELNSSSLQKLFLKEKIIVGKCVGRGSYGKVYRVKTKGNLPSKFQLNQISRFGERTGTDKLTNSLRQTSCDFNPSSPKQ